MRPQTQIGAVAALFVIGMTLAACQKTEAPPPIIRPVLSLVVQPGDAAAATYAGVVQARYQADLSFRVAGRVVARDVNLGEFVSRGQRLAALDPTSLEANLRSVEANRTAAEAQFTNADATLQREAALLAQHSTTQAAFDAAKQASDAALAAEKQAAAAFDKANEQLGYASLVADTDGVVTAMNIEVGQTVAEGTTALSIARPEVRDAVIDVGEYALPDAAIGAPFTVALQSNPAVTAQGKVREVAPEADPATRTHRVKIALDAPPPAFRLGSTIAAQPVQQLDKQILVPDTAILRKDGKTLVWLIEAQAGDSKQFTAKTVEVELGTLAGGQSGGPVLVTKGLAAGQRIAVAGVHSLTEGQSVKLDAGAAP